MALAVTALVTLFRVGPGANSLVWWGSAIGFVASLTLVFSGLSAIRTAGGPRLSLPGARRVTPTVSRRVPLLGELAERHGIVTPEILARALARQRESGGRLGEVLIEMGLATECQVKALLAIQANLRDLWRDAPSPSAE
jgi:hypothetical protein